MSEPWLKIASLVVGGLALNYIADAVPLTAPAVLALAFLGFILMTASEARGAGHGWAERLPHGAAGSLVQLVFGSVILGALLAGIALLPIGESRTFQLRAPRGWAFGYDYYQVGVNFHNYELVAGGLIVGLTVLAAVRGRDMLFTGAFLASSLIGMTLVLTSVRPENAILNTYLGWLAVGSISTFFVLALPGMLKTFADLWGFGRSAAEQAPPGPPHTASASPEGETAEPSLGSTSDPLLGR